MSRHFTKQEIDEIRKQLSTSSIRDTDFEETTSLTGDDYVAIVQDGRNKRISGDKFRNSLQNGPRGESTYEIAVRKGFKGTEEEWLAIPKSGQITLINNGNIENAADEEDITSEGELLKLKDRGSLFGMGYVILRRNKSFAEQVAVPNTIYEIRYDFDLGGDSVTIPDSCELRFVGGSLSNGTCVFNSTTRISGNPKIFCNVDGYLYHADITWFGAKRDFVSDDIAPFIEKAISISDHIIIPSGKFYIKTAAVIAVSSSKVVIDWVGEVNYNGSESEIDVVTISGKGGRCTLNMTGELRASGLPQNTADRFKVKGIVIENCKQSQFYVGMIMGFNVGLMLIGRGAGCSSNTFYLSIIYNCNEGILITQDNDGGRQGWANENLFIGGTIGCQSSWDLATKSAYPIYIGSLTSTDTYKKANQLVFIKPNVETPVQGLVPIYAENLQDSTIYNARFEGSNTYAKFVGNCGRIKFTCGYNQIGDFDLSEVQKSSTLCPFIYDLPYPYGGTFGPIINAGVVDGQDFYSDSVVYRATANTQALSLVEGMPVLLGDIDPVLWGIELSFSSNDLYNMLRIFPSNNTGNRMFVHAKCAETFDGSPVENSDIIVWANSLFDRGSYWTTGSNVSEIFVVFHKNVKKIILGFNTVSAVKLESRNCISLSSQSIPRSGNTRPAYKYKGQQFYDTLINKTIVWNGTSWINLDGSSL